MPYPARPAAPGRAPQPGRPLPQGGGREDASPTDQQSEEGLPPSLKLLIRVLKANPAALPQLVKACKAALAVVDGQNVPAGAPMTTNEYAEALVLNLVNTNEYPTLTCAELGVNSEYPNDAERLYDLARMAKFAWDHSGMTANSFGDPEERRTFMNLVDVGEVLPPVANQFPADMFPGRKDRHGNSPDYRPDNSRNDRRESRRPFGGRGKGRGRGNFFSECERDDHGWCKPARSVGEHLDSALGDAIEGRIKQAVQDRANEAVHQRLGDHIDQLIEQELLKRMPTGERWTTRTLKRVKQGAKTLFGGVPGAALGGGAGYLGAKAGAALAATGVAGPAGLLGGAVLGGPLGVAGAVGTGALLGGAAGYHAIGPLAARATKLLGKVARKSPRAVGALAGYLGGKGLRAAIHPVGAGSATGAMLAGGVAGTLGAGLAGPVGVGAAAGALGGAYLKRKFRKRAAAPAQQAAYQPTTGGPSQRVAEATADRVAAREKRRKLGYGTTPATPQAPDEGMWHPIPKTGIKQAPAPTEPAFTHEPAGSHMTMPPRGTTTSGTPQKPNTAFTKAKEQYKDIPAFLPEVPEVTQEDLARATKAAVDATLAAKKEAKRNKSRRKNYTRLHQEASVAHQQVAEAASELGYDELAEAHRRSATEFRRKAEAHRGKPTTNLLVTNGEDEYHLNLLVNALRDPREVRGFLEALDGLDRLLTNSGFNEEDHPRAKDGRWAKAHRAVLSTRGAIQGAVAGAAGGTAMSASAVAAPAVGFAAGALGGAYLGYKLAKKLEKSTSGLHPARQVSRYIGGFYGGGYGTRVGGTLGAGVGTAAGHLGGAALGGLAAGKAGALTGAAIGGPIGAAAGVTGGMLLGTALGSSAGQLASRGVEAVAKVGFKGGKLLWRGIDATAGRSVRSLLQNESSGGPCWVQITNDGGNCGDGPGGFQPGNTCAKGGGGGGGSPAPGSNAPHGVLGHVKEFFMAPKAGRKRAADRADRKAKEAEAAGDKAGAEQWRARATEHRSHIPNKSQPSTDTTTSHGRPAKVYSDIGHDAPPPVKPAKPEGSNRQPSTADDIAHAVAGERRALPAAMVGTMLGGAIAGPLGAAIGMGIPLWGAYHLDKKRRREEGANNSLVWEEVDNRRRGRGSRGSRGGRGGYGHHGNEHRDRDGRFATTEGRDQVEDKTPPRPHGGSGDFHEAMKPGTRYDKATGEYQSTKKAPPAPPSFPGGGAKEEQEVQYPRRVSEWDKRGKSSLSRMHDDYVDQEDDNEEEDADDAAKGGLKDRLADNSLTTNCGGNRACGCNTNNGRPSDDLDMEPDKACQILKDGKVHNRPLTKKQRGLFGVRCSRRDQH